MRRLLLLLPLILTGCGGNSDIQYEEEYQAPPPNIADPEPEPDPEPGPEPAPGPEPEPTAGPAPQPGPVLDLGLYVPMQAIIDDDGWTARLQGLPIGLNDVLWSGERFIAIGEDGVILTSQNGIDWAQQASGTGASLNAITSNGPDVLVVGQDGTVLLSTDHGENWTIRHSDDDINLHAVIVNDWQIVAGGRAQHTAGAYMMRSEDLGESWTAVESLPQSGHWSTDLVYASGLFVAATDIPKSIGGTQISYLSAAWSGSELMLAGGITWWYWWVGEPSLGPLDVGLSRHDGGLTWSTFNIDGYFESRGMAWGDGRFVAVGMASQLDRDGAIYTSP
jgi:hypothetical protein